MGSLTKLLSRCLLSRAARSSKELRRVEVMPQPLFFFVSCHSLYFLVFFEKNAAIFFGFGVEDGWQR